MMRLRLIKSLLFFILYIFKKQIIVRLSLNVEELRRFLYCEFWFCYDVVVNPDLDAPGLPVAYWCFESYTIGEISRKI